MCFKIQCSTKCREKGEDLKRTPLSEGEKKGFTWSSKGCINRSKRSLLMKFSESYRKHFCRHPRTWLSSWQALRRCLSFLKYGSSDNQRRKLFTDHHQSYEVCEWHFSGTWKSIIYKRFLLPLQLRLLLPFFITGKEMKANCRHWLKSPLEDVNIIRGKKP